MVISGRLYGNILHQILHSTTQTISGLEPDILVSELLDSDLKLFLMCYKTFNVLLKTAI